MGSHHKRIIEIVEKQVKRAATSYNMVQLINNKDYSNITYML